MRLSYVANNPSPYHTPILNALARKVDLRVIYMNRSDPMASFRDIWGVEPEFDHSFYWSKKIAVPANDFRSQFSVGVSKALRATRPDAVLFSSWGPLAWEPLLLSRVGRQQYKTVMWAESTLSSGLMRDGVSNSLRRLLVSRADAFVSNGTQASEFLASLGVSSDRIVTSCLPSNTVDPGQDLSRHGPRSGKRFIFVGRLIPRKRPVETVEAFRHVAEQVPGAHLTVVGDGPLEAEVRTAAQTMGDRVSVLGRLEGRALAEAMMDADTLVIPSLREVWGLVVNEAVSLGLFVVASDQVGSAADLVDEQNGVIFPANDLDEFARAMVLASERCAGKLPHDLQANARRACCTPERFAEDIKRAAEVAMGIRDNQNGTSVDGLPVAIAEDKWWSDIVRREIGEGAKLVAVSSHVPDSRVYRYKNKAWKIRRAPYKVPRGVVQMEEEARLLAGVGLDAEVRTGDGWKIMSQPWVEGETMESWSARASSGGRIRTLARVAGELRRLHGQGLAHRDIRPDNVVLTGDGGLEIIDLNRARQLSGVQRALADWFGLSRAGVSPWPFWKLALVTMFPKSTAVQRRGRGFVRRLIPKARPSTSDSDIGQLQRAWAIAASSPANAPGQEVAYYSFSYKGAHFRGERPWALRWEMLKDKVDFRDKRFVELGCNVGLLSSFASLSGAKDVRGVDRDGEIIRAAKLTAKALGAEATFQQVDLMGEDSWEEMLSGADIVTAMSLVHWLPDPDRVFRFLGKHSELIYEGHDPLDVETARLQAIGFDVVTVLGETERGRFLLHGGRSEKSKLHKASENGKSPLEREKVWDSTVLA